MAKKKKNLSSKTFETRNPEDYKSIFATEYHQHITKIDQLKKHDYDKMGLFYKGKPIGSGELCLIDKNKNHLSTDGVRLDHQHRKKGHGIHLYRHLIHTAILLGATRLYSSQYLNEHSRRMWDKKLEQNGFKVKRVISRKPCNECGCKTPRVLRYYIDLNTVL